MLKQVPPTNKGKSIQDPPPPNKSNHQTNCKELGKHKLRLFTKNIACR